jgi:DNA-directed RNA polymerase subunit H (RpoH/RPB5)
MEAETADIIIRSRNTILDILEERGYDPTPYRNISPEQILTLAEGHPRALDIFLKKKEGSAAPANRAVVVYQLQDRIRLKLGTFTRDIYQIPADGAPHSKINPDDDLIVVINEPYNEVFDKTALQMWQAQKARMVFFHIKQLVVHPGRHVLVPPHRKLSPEESKAELDRLHITQRSQLPLIKHSDIQSRVLGLVPGDLVEILRPSPTAGIHRVIRFCAA